MIYNINTAEYEIDEEGITRLRKDFEEMSKIAPPKIITLDDAVNKYDLVQTKRWSSYIKGLLLNLDTEPVTKETFKEKMSNVPDNLSFHAVKFIYLINEAKTNGFYSIPQACIHTKQGTPKWWVHPGSFRESVLLHLKDMQHKFIVWDSQDMIDAPALSFEEWSTPFLSLLEKKLNLHVAMCNEEHKKVIEFHVGEDRPEYYNLNRRVYDMFGGKKPYLIGECSPDIQDYFSDDETSNVHIQAKTILKEDDLLSLYDFHPNINEINTDNLRIYIK